jgi:hypothetical protein
MAKPLTHVKGIECIPVKINKGLTTMVNATHFWRMGSFFGGKVRCADCWLRVKVGMKDGGFWGYGGVP